MTPPPEKLDAQTVDSQHSMPFQFLTSLPRFRSGWFANKGAAANPAGASRLQSSRPARRVAELLSFAVTTKVPVLPSTPIGYQTPFW